MRFPPVAAMPANTAGSTDKLQQTQLAALIDYKACKLYTICVKPKLCSRWSIHAITLLQARQVALLFHADKMGVVLEVNEEAGGSGGGLTC